tara:strand:- start:345 stop:896 length:552 start_codon:yes stop_codon:yes gene_type:complete
MSITSDHIHSISNFSMKLDTHVNLFYRECQIGRSSMLIIILKTFEDLTKLFIELFHFTPSSSSSDNDLDLIVLIGTIEYQSNSLRQITVEYTTEDYDFLKTKMLMLIRLGNQLSKFNNTTTISQPRGRPRKGKVWDKVTGNWIETNSLLKREPKPPLQIKKSKKCKLSNDEEDIVNWLNNQTI